MKKGYYIVPNFTEREKGILNKINYHIELMARNTQIEKVSIPNNKFLTKIVYRLPFGSAGGNYNFVLSKIKDPDFLYIRKGNIDRKLIVFLKKIKQLYPKCKVLLEIPTYPYDKDALSKWQNFFILKKDRYYRNKLSQFVDRIVTYSMDDEIFGIKTIKAHNGVDCSKIMAISNYDLNPNEIRLIGVAQFRVHHGFERIIEGLYNYYKTSPTRIVRLTLVGDGLEAQHYKDLVNKLGLSEYVCFPGSQRGNQLDEFYNNSDIAVSSLGMYKLGLEYVSTLKNCEYVAKGLPVVLGYKDYVLETNPYCLYVENNAAPVNVGNIVSFYDRTYQFGKKKIVDEIREIAEKKADINQTYSDVMKFILE